MKTPLRTYVTLKTSSLSQIFLLFCGFTLVLSACFPDLPPEDLDAVLSEDVLTDIGQDAVAPDGSTGDEVPQNLVASTDEETTVTLTWSSVTDALSYRVYRCEVAACGDAGSWALLPNGETLSVSYIDLGAEAPPPPATPSITATTNSTSTVLVSWAPVDPTLARTYSYQVKAVFAANKESAPSQIAVGSRGPASITGYEISFEEGPWTPAGTGGTWSDDDASAPTLTAGVATASQGTLAGWVALSLGGTASTAGTMRSYRVRAVNNAGAGQPSEPATGGRAAISSWSVSWERSTGATPDEFVAIAGSSGTSFQDVGAPENGATRYYRAVVTATGAEPARTEAVAGARMPPPETPGNVRASNDLLDYVEVKWSRVGSATGYRIYRDGNEVAVLTGGETTSWRDESATLAVSNSWQAPSAVTASTDRLDGVELTWVSPTQPVGPTARYEVEAINTAGTGGRSAETVGRRAAPAIVEFEVEDTPTGAGAHQTTLAATTTSWLNANAPLPTITEGTTSASQGDYRAHVRLVSENAAIEPSKVTYRMRGLLESGGTTPWSSSTIGERGAGALTWQWQRATTENGTYSNITDATTAAFEDAMAPANGDSYWYRLKLTAQGTTEWLSATVEGWRLAFVDVSVGYQHACALTARGRIWCWGDHDLVGQFEETASTFTLSIPAPVVGVTTATHISAGTSHSCARTSDGLVVCWGAASDLQVYGLGENRESPKPSTVMNLTDAAEVAVGKNHSCARTTSGRVRCWGLGGRLGNNSTLSSNLPVEVVWSNQSPVTAISSIALFNEFSCAVVGTANATVACWGLDPGAGNNPYGNIGDGAGVSRSFAVNAGPLSNVWKLSRSNSQAYMACALAGNAASNTLSCWGWGPVAEDNSILTGRFTRPTQSSRLNTTLSSVALGAGVGGFGCALTSVGLVRCWGNGSNGQLGVSGTTNSVAPLTLEIPGVPTSISAGPFAACAISSFNVLCWGANFTGVGPEMFANPTSIFP